MKVLTKILLAAIVLESIKASSESSCIITLSKPDPKAVADTGVAKDAKSTGKIVMLRMLAANEIEQKSDNSPVVLQISEEKPAEPLQKSDEITLESLQAKEEKSIEERQTSDKKAEEKDPKKAEEKDPKKADEKDPKKEATVVAKAEQIASDAKDKTASAVVDATKSIEKAITDAEAYTVHAVCTFKDLTKETKFDKSFHCAKEKSQFTIVYKTPEKEESTVSFKFDEELKKKNPIDLKEQKYKFSIDLTEVKGVEDAKECRLTIGWEGVLGGVFTLLMALVL